MPHIRHSPRALALALLPDPFYLSISVGQAGSEEARLQLLERYFEYSLREAQRTGRCVLAANEADGAAAWLLPRTQEVQDTEAAEKARFMAALLGPQGSANYHAIVDFMSPRAEPLVPADAWYLSILGIHPQAQGAGLGLALLQPTLAEASRLGRTCFLETFTPRNIAFYQRLGFATVAEVLEPTTGAPYFIMRREA